MVILLIGIGLTGFVFVAGYCIADTCVADADRHVW